jgi:hypothetical protein
LKTFEFLISISIDVILMLISKIKPTTWFLNFDHFAVNVNKKVVFTEIHTEDEINCCLGWWKSWKLSSTNLSNTIENILLILSI